MTWEVIVIHLRARHAVCMFGDRRWAKAAGESNDDNDDGRHPDHRHLPRHLERKRCSSEACPDRHDVDANAWCDLRSVRSPLDEASDGQIGLPGVTVEPDAGVVQRHLGREPSEEAAQSMGTLMFQPEVV